MDPLKVLAGKDGKAHLSYSSLSKFRAAPNVWALSYLFRVKDDAGPAAWRGRAVEAGLDRLLWGEDMAAAEAAMRDEWLELTGGEVTEEIRSIAMDLTAFLKQAHAATKDMGTPLTRQTRVQIEIPGLDIPLIGYTDYRWGDKGLDLKTTLRMPSEPRPDHAEQMAIYAKATGLPFSLLYVTPKKWAIHETMDDGSALESVFRTAHALVHAIKKADDPRDFMRMYAPDFSSFYWSPPLIEAAKGVYAGATP